MHKISNIALSMIPRRLIISFRSEFMVKHSVIGFFQYAVLISIRYLWFAAFAYCRKLYGFVYNNHFPVLWYPPDHSPHVLCNVLYFEARRKPN